MSVKNRRWMDAHDDMLKAEIGAGVSYNEAVGTINARFGTSFSRNAAIGRGKRIGLCVGEPRRLEQMLANIAKARKAPRSQIRKPKPMPKVQIFECDDATNLRTVDVIPLHLPLLELAPEHCRWPYGDSNFTFCGNPVWACGPYCEPHASLSVGRGTGEERNAHRVARSAA